MSNGKVMIILLTVGSIKKTEPFAIDMIQKLNQICLIMQQSVTCGSKNAKGVKKIVKKDDLFKLELDVDKLDIDELNELKSVPISLKCFKKCSLKKNVNQMMIN